MAVQLIAQLIAKIVGAPGGDPTDVKTDVAAAKNGTLNVYTPPAAGSGGFLTVEPLDVPQNFLDAPPQPVLSSQAGGALGARTEYVKITYVNNWGETVGSVEQSLAVAANNVLVVDSPPALAGATGWIPYVTETEGDYSTAKQSNAIAIGTNWVEPNGGLVAGAAIPTVNTTAIVNGDCNVFITQGAGSIDVNGGQLIATLDAQVVNAAGGDPIDVDDDSTAAPDGTVNIYIPPAAGSGGFLTIEPVAKAVIAALSSGPCSVFVTQGSASLTLNPAQ